MTGREESRRPAGDTVARAAELVRLFCPDPADFGVMRAVAAEQVPEPDRGLLDHGGHMTVTVERHHACRVGLRVISTLEAAAGDVPWYAREIVLIRPDRVVVQYGIVRIDLSAIGGPQAAAVRERTAPLGRILVGAGTLCEVRRVGLMRIEPGPHVSGIVGNVGPLYGRVADIRIDGRPAIELLEVVVPAAPPAGG